MTGCGKDFLMKTFLYIVITIKFKLILTEPREANTNMSNKTGYYENLEETYFERNWMKSKNNESFTEKVVIRPLLVGLTGSTSGYQGTDGPVSL